MALPRSAAGAVDRARLVHDHLELARRLAHRIHARCRQYVELDELIALGNVGLAEAAARFDPSAGVAFGAFAHYRVQGAILDGLRRLTPMPRREWRRLTALRAASAALEQRCLDAARTGRAIAPHARAQAVDELREALASVRTIYVRSLGSTDDTELPAIEADPGPAIDRARLMPEVVAAMAALPAREQAVLRKHYFEEMNLLDAGLDLGVSKSAASRIHARAVGRLRRTLGVDRDGTRRAQSLSSAAPARAAAKATR